MSLRSKAPRRGYERQTYYKSFISWRGYITVGGDTSGPLRIPGGTRVAGVICIQQSGERHCQTNIPLDEPTHDTAAAPENQPTRQNTAEQRRTGERTAPLGGANNVVDRPAGDTATLLMGEYGD